MAVSELRMSTPGLRPTPIASKWHLVGLLANFVWDGGGWFFGSASCCCFAACGRGCCGAISGPWQGSSYLFGGAFYGLGAVLLLLLGS